MGGEETLHQEAPLASVVSSLRLFQQGRRPRENTLSAEVCAAPLTSSLTTTTSKTTVTEVARGKSSGHPYRGAMLNHEQLGEVGSVPSGVIRASGRGGAVYEPVPGSYWACGSCPRHGSPPEPSPDIGRVDQETALTTTQWLGVPLEQSTPLPLGRLWYAWRRYTRSGITVGEVLSQVPVRPDLLRIRQIYGKGLTEEASLALGRLLAEGTGAPYQLPDEIPSDRTFAYSIEEVEYVDRMATYTFHLNRWCPQWFVLAEVVGLYVSPRPYAYWRTLAALQKSACSLMRLHSIALAPHDWSAYRQAREADGRVLRSASFECGLSTDDFPELPTSKGRHFPLWEYTSYFLMPSSISAMLARTYTTPLTRSSSIT